MLEGARTDWEEISPHVGFLRDPGGALSIDDLLDGDSPDRFLALAGRSADFGYTHDIIWLRFAVTNASDHAMFRIAFRENFLQRFSVWFVDGAGKVTALEDQGAGSVFSSRRVAYPELTVPLALAPGAKGSIYVRYWSGGSSELSWRVYESEAFADWSSRRTARNFVYYGMMILLTVAALVAFAVTRQKVFGAYGVYALFGLLFMMHADGNGFEFLWPNLPRFNAFATVPLGAGLIVSGTVFARCFLQTRRFHPYLDMAMRATILLALGLTLATLAIDAQPIKRVLIILSLAATILFTVAGLVAARTRFREVRFYVLAWTGAVISSTIMMLRHWFGVEISEEVQFNSIRIVLVFDAAMMGLAILDRINQMKLVRQMALEASLSEARKSLELGRRLQDLEQQVSLAERLARAERRNLTETVHDLRQPLTALRLNIRNVTDAGSRPEAVAEVERTIGYLESIVTTQLAQALSLPAEPLRSEGPGTMTPLEPVMAAVIGMFAADAAEKGLHLRMVPTSLAAAVPPLALMRMLSNLVANAIRATERGGVLVGVRHGGGPRIEVRDTGSGLTPLRFQDAMAHGPAAAVTAQGSGLGLSIVRDLALRHAMRFDLGESRQGGTTLRLWLPPGQ
ncbi:MAG: sensor histidine kinase [Rhodobacteraceae bacterium]|nr:sensor histidine kinase [Paracoccaceae bacterium]